jgi:hypothetical protein
LAKAKADAVNELVNYKNADDYRAEQKTELAAAITAGTDAINNAGSIAEVATELAKAKAVIDAIKTNAQLTADEAAELGNGGTVVPPTAAEIAAKSVKSMNAAVKTLYVQKGKTVKIPYVIYANAGQSKNKVAVAWSASKKKIVSVNKTKASAKSGKVTSGKLDAKSVLSVKGAKVGTTKITLKAGTKKMTLTIKVIKKSKVTKVATYKINKFTKYQQKPTTITLLSGDKIKVYKLKATPVTLTVGKSKGIKVSKINKNAHGNIATFKIAKKYTKYLKVDAAGKLTAVKSYKSGKKAIAVKVKVGSKTTTIKVKVKK